MIRKLGTKINKQTKKQSQQKHRIPKLNKEIYLFLCFEKFMVCHKIFHFKVNFKEISKKFFSSCLIYNQFKRNNVTYSIYVCVATYHVRQINETTQNIRKEIRCLLIL